MSPDALLAAAPFQMFSGFGTGTVSNVSNPIFFLPMIAFSLALLITFLSSDLLRTLGFRIPDEYILKLRELNVILSNIISNTKWPFPASKQLLPGKAGIGIVNGRIIRMPKGNDIQRIIALDTTNRELKEGASWREIFAEIQNWMGRKDNLHVTEVVVKINGKGVEKLYSITRTSIYPPIGGQ